MPSRGDKAPASSQVAIGAPVDEKAEERRRRRKESSRHREKEDRDAKRRARESRSEVGIFRSKDGPSKRKGARSSSRHDKEDAKAKDRARSPKSNRSSTARASTRHSSDRRAKEKNRPTSRSIAPGAVSVDASSDRKSSRKEPSKSKSEVPVRRSTQDRAARERAKTLSAHPEEEVALPVAEQKSEPEVELVEEAVENVENAKLKKLESDNEELRQQMRRMMENNQTDVAEDANNESLEEKPSKSCCLWYLCGFVVVAAIVVGVVVFLMMRPKEDSQSTLVVSDETPSSSPSLALTGAPTFSEQTIQDCLAITEGRPVLNQDDLTGRQFNLKFQVLLMEDSDLGLIEKLALQGKMQQGPLLMLTGCDPAALTSSFRGSRRMSVIDSNVGDAKVIVGNVTDSCATNETSPPCSEVDVKLYLFLEAYETDTSLIQLTEFVFGQDAFAKNAGPPFGTIDLVSVEPQDLTVPSPDASLSGSPVGSPSGTPSTAPTATHSHNPSRAPGADPTIAPSVSPTKLASAAPSMAPSSSPSPGPSISPSIPPSRIPVSDPTESPTVSTGSPTRAATNSPSNPPTRTPRSNSPTIVPSFFPSPSPSTLPSASPTSAPSASPSESPSRSPSVVPSPAPSITPGRCGPLVGGAQCSCDSEYYHCSAWGYCGYGFDEGAFYVAGQPREYDCPSGPVSLITSSASAMQSSTRTASNGQVMGAWRAIDGSTDGSDFFTCTQTFYDAYAWWQVNLGLTAEVSKVSIWNIDSNWSRMEGSQLELRDSNNLPLSTVDMTLGTSSDQTYETFIFDPAVENVTSIAIMNWNGEPLQICEVQAYGYIQ